MAEWQLRDDLTLSRQESPEGARCVIKDPRAGRFFRVGEVEYALAQQLDGRTPTETIRRNIERQFDAHLPVETFDRFIEKLRRLGLLEQEEGDPAEAQPAKPSRVRGSILYKRFKVLDPDRLLDWLIERLGFFFTPAFVWLSGATLCLAAVVVVADWDLLVAEMGRLSWTSVVALWVVILAVTSAHEFAHGLTCKRFGGRVHEMGFLLIFFQPALYCNISDAWLFPERWKRLWVTFAGAYFELFVWAVAVLAWRVTAPETLVNQASLVVMMGSGIKSLFNLNPLIKLDGYYLLSDWLEIPNLRQRAFRHLGRKLRSLFRRDGAGAAEEAQHGRVYVVYSVASLAFMVLLLGSIGLKAAAFLVERYEGLGFLAFAAVVGAVFRRPIGKGLRMSSGLIGSGPGIWGRLGRPIKIVAALGLLIGALALIPMGLTVGGEFTVTPAENADVRAQVSGLIGKLPLRQGDRVEEGQLVAELARPDLRVELKQTEARIAAAQAKLRRLRTGPRQEKLAEAEKRVAAAETRHEQAERLLEQARRVHRQRLAQAKTAVRKAEQRLQIARRDRDHLQRLMKKGAASEHEVRRAEDTVELRCTEVAEAKVRLEKVRADHLAEQRKAVAVAEAELAEARSELALVEAGTRPEDIAAAEAEVERLQARAAHLRQRVERLTLRSPVAGVVTTADLEEKLGQRIEEGQLVLSVHQRRPAIAELRVSEKQIAPVAAGQPVTVKARAYPYRTFTGRVEAIAPVARTDQDGPGARTFRVEVRVEAGAELLKGGMSGHAKIECDRRSALSVLTRGLVRFFRVEFWSWW